MSVSRKPKVVVAEDDPLLRLDARQTLEDAGFDVVEAEDGASALATIEQDASVDVVFTDVQMPGPICGLDLARRVHILRPQTPVFVASGQAAEDEVHASGCRGFFRKPYALELVVRELRAAVA